MNNTDINNTLKTNEDLKKERRRIYMRNYMKKYNEKKKPRKPLLTENERTTNLKNSHKKYYLKNKNKILEKARQKRKEQRIINLQNKLLKLQSNI